MFIILNKEIHCLKYLFFSVICLVLYNIGLHFLYNIFQFYYIYFSRLNYKISTIVVLHLDVFFSPCSICTIRLGLTKEKTEKYCKQ